MYQQLYSLSLRHVMPSNLIRTLMYHISYVQTIIFIVTTPSNAIQPDKNSHVSYVQAIIFIVTTPSNAIQHDKNPRWMALDGVVTMNIIACTYDI